MKLGEDTIQPETLSEISLQLEQGEGWVGVTGHHWAGAGGSDDEGQE